MKLVVLLLLFLPSTFGQSNQVCISPGGRFPPFANEGKPPKRASKGPKDLTLCRVFRQKTCCDVAQTHTALVNVRRLALKGEAKEECLQLWELLECSICDPHVGVKPGPPVICTSLCDRVYKACCSAYFSMDAKTQVLEPCGVSDFICGRASEWTSNGTEFCSAAGFAVTPADDIEETSCYGGKASLDLIADSWQASKTAASKDTESSGAWKDFQQWGKDMPFIERVGWAVGGMVLTAGILFASKRKGNSQRQKQAAIQRAVKNFQNSPTRGKGKRSGR